MKLFLFSAPMAGAIVLVLIILIAAFLVLRGKGKKPAIQTELSPDGHKQKAIQILQQLEELKSVQPKTDRQELENHLEKAGLTLADLGTTADRLKVVVSLNHVETYRSFLSVYELTGQSYLIDYLQAHARGVLPEHLPMIDTDKLDKLVEDFGHVDQSGIATILPEAPLK